jgi:hypothetical protein
MEEKPKSGKEERVHRKGRKMLKEEEKSARKMG